MKESLQPPCCINACVPCEKAHTPASELACFGTGPDHQSLKAETPRLVWAVYYLDALAKALIGGSGLA